MKLYHVTDVAAARGILDTGFRDTRGGYGTIHERAGVWLSDQPLTANDGVLGDVILEVETDLSPDVLAAYEWVEEGKGYREFLVPAAIVNGRSKVTVNQ